MRKERILYLDFIRAISIVAIVVFHFNTSMFSHGINSAFILFQNYKNGNLGNIGVSLFFIISGAALMYSYRDNFSIKTFLAKRFMSIYPMFWMAYAIAFLYLFYFNKTIEHGVPNINFILTLIGMDGYLLYRIPSYYLLGEWFLGCIILLYLCFPLLRKLMINKPIVLLISICVFYIAIVQTYPFKMDIDRNFITRIPDLLVGMYFIQYIKKVRFYQFIAALSISSLLLFVEININQMYKITIIGISLFFVLVYIIQHIKLGIINNLFFVVSKYSYSIFLTHHVIMSQLLLRFKGVTLTSIESYCLFLITCIVIFVVSVYLYKITDKLIVNLKDHYIKYVS